MCLEYNLRFIPVQKTHQPQRGKVNGLWMLSLDFVFNLIEIEFE